MSAWLAVLYISVVKIHGYPADIRLKDLTQEDIDFLNNNMDEFLESIGRTELRDELSKWDEWHKLEALTFEEKQAAANKQPDLKSFRLNEWIKGGMFSDVAVDDFVVNPTVVTGLYRQRVPKWENAKFAAPCEFHCPSNIPTQKRYNLIRQGKLEDAIKLVLEYTPFPGSVCGKCLSKPLYGRLYSWQY